MKLRAILIGAVIGLVVPLILLGLHILSGQLAGFTTVVLWPSSIMLMATEGMTPAGGRIVLAQSVAINMFVYAGIGAIVSFFQRKK